MHENTLVLDDIVVPGDTAVYTIRVVVYTEFLHEDEDDDDNHLDYMSSIWDIKRIELTDYTRKDKKGIETSWGIGFSLVDKNEYNRVVNFVESFDFTEMVFDKIRSGNTQNENIYGDYWL